MGNKWAFGNKVEDILQELAQETTQHEIKNLRLQGELPQEPQPETAADKLTREKIDAFSRHFSAQIKTLRQGEYSQEDSEDARAREAFFEAADILVAKMSAALESPELHDKLTMNVLLYVLAELFMATHATWEPDAPFEQFCGDWCNKTIHYYNIRAIVEKLSSVGLDLSIPPKV